MIALFLAAQADISREIPWGPVALIACRNASGQGTGTAFHIGGGRYITAAHVVTGRECTIAGQPAGTVRVDSDLDFAEVTGPNDRPSLVINCDGFRPGSEYLAMGYAGGVLRVNLPLLNSGFGRDPASGNSMFVGGDMIPGMSGGPIIDRSYRVAGVNLQRWPSGALSLSLSLSLSLTYLCGAK